MARWEDSRTCGLSDSSSRQTFSYNNSSCSHSHNSTVQNCCQVKVVDLGGEGWKESLLLRKITTNLPWNSYYILSYVWEYYFNFLNLKYNSYIKDCDISATLDILLLSPHLLLETNVCVPFEIFLKILFFDCSWHTILY